MRRPALALGSLLLAATVALTGCGSDPSEEAPQETKVLSFTLKDGQPTPNGEVVKVARDQSIQIDIDSDAAGSLHVHSTPERSIEFAAGKTTSETFSIDKPGVVEVELHEPAMQVFRLEVR